MFLTAENVPSVFDATIWTWKHQPYHFSIFQTSKYVRRDLVCCLFASKYVFSFDFRHFKKKNINYTYLVAVSSVNGGSTPYSFFLTAENVPLTFGFFLWFSKNHGHLFSNFESSKYLIWRLVCSLFLSKYVISALLWHFNL